MKYIYFLFLFFLLQITFLEKNCEAKYYYNIPNSLKLDDVNSNIKYKTQTRYDSEDEIPQQYKGKLRYMPSNNTLTNFRKNRFYSSFYISSSVPKISNLNYYNNKKNQIIISLKEQKQTEYTYLMNIGYYLYNAMAVEFEYSVFKTTMNLSKNIVDKDNNKINQFIFNSYGYFLNFLFESNYSKLIPIFGGGIGFINNNINNMYYNGESIASDFSIKYNVAYNFFVGIEYAINDSLLFSLKYKIISDLNMKFIDKKNKIDTMNLDFKNNFLSIGIKYIW